MPGSSFILPPSSFLVRCPRMSRIVPLYFRGTTSTPSWSSTHGVSRITFLPNVERSEIPAAPGSHFVTDCHTLFPRPLLLVHPWQALRVSVSPRPSLDSLDMQHRMQHRMQHSCCKTHPTPRPLPLRTTISPVQHWGDTLHEARREPEHLPLLYVSRHYVLRIGLRVPASPRLRVAPSSPRPRVAASFPLRRYPQSAIRYPLFLGTCAPAPPIFT